MKEGELKCVLGKGEEKWIYRWNSRGNGCEWCQLWVPFSPYFSRNAPPYLQDHACEAKNRGKILSEFGIREGWKVKVDKWERTRYSRIVCQWQLRLCSKWRLLDHVCPENFLFTGSQKNIYLLLSPSGSWRTVSFTDTRFFP